VALMKLGSQWEETLLCICEHSPMGLVSRQWDTTDLACVLCDHSIHSDFSFGKSQNSQGAKSGL
jgi:hypothetical protein